MKKSSSCVPLHVIEQNSSTIWWNIHSIPFHSRGLKKMPTAKKLRHASWGIALIYLLIENIHLLYNLKTVCYVFFFWLTLAITKKYVDLHIYYWSIVSSERNCCKMIVHIDGVRCRRYMPLNILTRNCSSDLFNRAKIKQWKNQFCINVMFIYCWVGQRI